MCRQTSFRVKSIIEEEVEIEKICPLSSWFVTEKQFHSQRTWTWDLFWFQTFMQKAEKIKQTSSAVGQIENKWNAVGLYGWNLSPEFATQNRPESCLRCWPHWPQFSTTKLASPIHRFICQIPHPSFLPPSTHGCAGISSWALSVAWILKLVSQGLFLSRRWTKLRPLLFPVPGHIKLDGESWVLFFPPVTSQRRVWHSKKLTQGLKAITASADPSVGGSWQLRLQATSNKHNQSDTLPVRPACMASASTGRTWQITTQAEGKLARFPAILPAPVHQCVICVWSWAGFVSEV